MRSLVWKLWCLCTKLFYSFIYLFMIIVTQVPDTQNVALRFCTHSASHTIPTEGAQQGCVPCFYSAMTRQTLCLCPQSTADKYPAKPAILTAQNMAALFNVDVSHAACPMSHNQLCPCSKSQNDVFPTSPIPHCPFRPPLSMSSFYFPVCCSSGLRHFHLSSPLFHCKT